LRAGTGATTWESSIAMSLFFSSHPHILYGSVIELGSGVGLGGILTNLLVGPSIHHDLHVHSMTLTDSNAEVLEFCKQNVQRANLQKYPLRVSKLDWYDLTRQSEATNTHARKYDTIIACDCAYRYPDLTALSTAMDTLLRRGKNSKIHIFGPHNRGALQELFRQLRDERGMDVVVEEFDMQRYRLKPLHDSISQEEGEFAAKYDVKFLHMTASLRDNDAPMASKANFMTEID
jgi:predicted nicotinamide N-methyase